MAHKYFADDTQQRKDYFVKQFLKLASASELREITDVGKLHSALKKASKGKDASLHHYFKNMDEKDLNAFFSMPKIFNLAESNLEIQNEELKEIKQEKIQKLEKKIETEKVKEVKQKEGKTRLFYEATIKGERVIARKTFIMFAGKKVARFRDEKGRWASIK